MNDYIITMLDDRVYRVIKCGSYHIGLKVSFPYKHYTLETSKMPEEILLKL